MDVDDRCRDDRFKYFGSTTEFTPQANSRYGRYGYQLPRILPSRFQKFTGIMWTSHAGLIRANPPRQANSYPSKPSTTPKVPHSC
jgi:hypothetical protein